MVDTARARKLADRIKVVVAETLELGGCDLQSGHRYSFERGSADDRRR